MKASKAERLARLQPWLRKSRVPSLLYFSVGEWQGSRSRILESVLAQWRGRFLAVRSSTRNEDGRLETGAGRYRSCLSIPAEADEIQRAVDRVVTSYPDSGAAHQILIQEMVSRVVRAGVASTHCPHTGAPYYTIEYDPEPGKTDRVTGGQVTPHRLLVYRGTPLEQLRPVAGDPLLVAIAELERLWPGVPLQLEFAQDNRNQIWLLQVRPLTVRPAGRGQRLDGELARTVVRLKARLGPDPTAPARSTLLGQMPDWNPVELLGSFPSPLSTSLFRELITDSVWSEARVRIGYRSVRGPLLMVLAGRPYIDVRRSFTSLLPDGLAPSTEGVVVDAWVDRLRRNPELHDKVEFEVAQSVWDFNFDRDLAGRYPDLARFSGIGDYRLSLRRLTQLSVLTGPGSSLSFGLDQIDRLKKIQQGPHSRCRQGSPLRRALRLLHECLVLGTLPFAVIARHAFIAEAFLRSAIVRGSLEREVVNAFKSSLPSPARRLARLLAEVRRGETDAEEFLREFGHLRPGTFDILSARYDQRPQLFDSSDDTADADCPPVCRREIEGRLTTGLTPLLQESGLGISPEGLLDYAATALTGREAAKFVFSRHLSDALELIRCWGARHALSRFELDCLTVPDLRRHLDGRVSVESLRARSVRRQLAADRQRLLQVPTLITAPGDLYVLPVEVSRANFVTTRSVEGPVLFIDRENFGHHRARARIVCVEQADPGYDWLFAERPAGLVTCYGGSHSHMSVRCQELGLPAAIGLGPQQFHHVRRARRIELRCAEGVVRAL